MIQSSMNMNKFSKIILTVFGGLLIPLLFFFSVKITLASDTQPVTARYERWQMQTKETTETYALSPEGMTAEANIFHMASTITGWIGTAAVGPGPRAASQLGLESSGGAVGTFGNLIAHLTTQPPAHTATYVADVLQNSGLVSPAYAQQGAGFSALEPVLPVWKAFRNIAYFGFVLVFIVIGFMIMFRAKINPQTVISIQAAFPQIVITLILITFSYAIAALMIDLVYLIIYLLIGTFSSFGLITTTGIQQTQNILLGENIFGIAFKYLIGNPITQVETVTSNIAYAIAQIVESIFTQLGEGAGNFAGLSAGALAYVIFAVVILIAVFKLFFQLLLAYIGIIFNVIFAPILLLFNAFPGSESFFNWLKNLFANAIVFPVTALMLLLGAVLTGSTEFGINSSISQSILDDSQQALRLPFVGAGVPAGAMTAIIGIGFIIMMPKVIEIIQKMLGIEGGFAGMAGQALASPIGVGADITHKMFGASQAEEYTQKGVFRRAPLPGTTLITPRGFTFPKWLDLTRHMRK